MPAHCWACVFHHAGAERLHMLNHTRLKSLLSGPFNFLLVYVLFLLVIRKSPTSGSWSYKKHVRRWRQTLLCLVHSCHSSVVLFLSLTPGESTTWHQLWELGDETLSPLCPPSSSPHLPLHAVVTSCLHRLSFSPELLTALTSGLERFCRTSGSAIPNRRPPSGLNGLSGPRF